MSGLFTNVMSWHKATFGGRGVNILDFILYFILDLTSCCGKNFIKAKKDHYRKVASRSTCYYSENQVFRGATNQDMSLTETCFYSKIQKFWILKSRLVTWVVVNLIGEP